LKALKAEQFQPVRMWLAVQQFCRTFTNAFRPIATLEPAALEKETQQIQIILANMPSQKKVIP